MFAASKMLLLLIAAWTLIISVKAASQSSHTTALVCPPVLPYISLGSTAGVQREYVGHFDDGASHAIHIPGGFPFGNLTHSFAYVEINGIISFSEPIYHTITLPFPEGAPGRYFVAPYMDNVDLRLAGDVSYEVHSRSANNPGSDRLLDEVSGFVKNSTGQSFEGSWMLVAEWRDVHPWPHGEGPTVFLIYPATLLMNTFQGLVITDGNDSYTVFLYHCGDITWSSASRTGFSAAGSPFANYPLHSLDQIGCLNLPHSQWYSVVYLISLPNATLPLPPPIEPPQSSYLSILGFTNSTVTSGTLPPCQDCSAAVTAPGSGFPFGEYYHSTIYISTNGIFSFGQDLHQDYPSPFPSTDPMIRFSHVVAPYWSSIDTRLEGHVTYEVHVTGESSISDDYLGRVSSLINSEEDDPGFIGSWMIVATWDSVHPFPHGSSPERDRADPYLQSTNTFQGILITNGTQSYSVFTYECDQMEWSDGATIGYNAGVEYHETHPLSGTLAANAVDCLHSDINIEVNNIIHNLAFSTHYVTSPAPTGSCVRAGYANCCRDGNCIGDFNDCYCDEFCFHLKDCCSDISDICPVESPPSEEMENSTYLIFGSENFLSRISPTGSDLHVLVHQSQTVVIAADYDYWRGYLYWFDQETLYRSNLNGTNIEYLLNTSLHTIGDIAVDWISNNLYWTDTFNSLIEVMDLDTGRRRELLRTQPYGIAVDPRSRYIFWTNWGVNPKIERASMDGSDRTVLYHVLQTQPTGITIDYQAEKIYWTDLYWGTIQCSNLDGSGWHLLLAGSIMPYSLTVNDNMVYWSDWNAVGIHAIHKLASNGGSVQYRSSRGQIIWGIEAVNPNHQAQDIIKPCDGSPCAFMCLPSGTNPFGYSCVCPDGYMLATDGVNCTDRDTPGSCVAAGYESCCTEEDCFGSPPTCSCHSHCYIDRNCCPDINVTCPAVGSCAAAGYRACCWQGVCEVESHDSECYCDHTCHEYDDCCPDKLDLCPMEREARAGSCYEAGYTACCIDAGSDCLGVPNNCKCDAECRDHGDCCYDVDITCPLISYPHQTVWLPYLDISGTVFTLPRFDDGHSAPINIPLGFPIGNDGLFDAFVGSNGVISFQEGFPHHQPVLFPSGVSFAFLLAPFWSDIDPSIYGSIHYQIHDQLNSALLLQVNDFISNYTDSSFTGTWMLVVKWTEVVEHDTANPTNTFQAIAITDGSQSYAVYTYRCGDLQWSGGATIGYNGGPVGNFYANHPLSGQNARSIACQNLQTTEWSNVVYNISCDVCIPTEPPPTIEPPQNIYLEYLERTSNSKTMDRCDDCTSDAIDLVVVPVPFGDFIHIIAYISSNGLISFGHRYSHHDASWFPNEDDTSAFLVAPYWGDIDNSNLGEIWYETHISGWSAISDSMLENVSNLVRSEQSLSSFQGALMIVATWNGSVPYGGTGLLSNTFQGIVITDGRKTYAVYTYHCSDVQWSDGSVIGFNAGGSYYANHPLSDSIAARDIDCVHRPGSEWNNVIYDLNPNVTVDSTSTTEVTTPEPSSQPETPYTPPIPALTTVNDLLAISQSDSDSELVVSWSPPEGHSDTDINQYYVIVTNYSLDLVANKTVPANTTSINITDLGPFIPYNITVIVYFKIGHGPPNSILIFTHQGVPPVSPSNVKVERFDSGTKIRVSWDPLTPEQAWGFVTNYTVSYKKKSEKSRKRQTLDKIVPGHESSTIIEDLDPNHEYSVSVRAGTNAGNGKVSESVSIQASMVATNVDGGSGMSGAALGGGVAASAIALIIVTLLALCTVWMIKRKTKANEIKLLGGDLTIENQSYKSSTVPVSCSYTTVDNVPSYHNPLYDANVAGESVVMLESDQALNTGDAVYDDSHYEVPITKNTFKID